MKFSTRGRLTTAVTISLALVATTAACGRDGDDPQGGDAAGQSVTLSLSTLNNPFFVDVRDGAQAAADELGVDLEVVDAQNDSTTQANQIANAVTGGADGVVINPVDSDAAGAAVQPALATDLPVVGVDRAVEGADITSLVSSDN
ncbi:substrate-binding domain-containing protein, partial [Isoptericola halotolerans]